MTLPSEESIEKDKKMQRIKSYEDHIGAIVYMVPVPIGNDKDITLRAIEVFKEADLICCEDTRTTGALLSRLGIKPKRLESLYSQVEAKNPKLLFKIFWSKG